MVRSVTAKQLLQETEAEDDLAKAVADFLRVAWPTDLPWWHTPNGGARVQVERRDRTTGKTYRFSPEAAKLKAMGVRAGVPDLTFILPNGRAAFIELKVGTNDLSDEQRDLRGELLGCTCGYQVARSVEDVERICAKWLFLYDRRLRASILPRSAA